LWDNLLFSANTIAPVFILVVIGLFLRAKNFVDEGFIKTSSKLVYNIALPVFIFSKLSVLRLSEAIDFGMISFIYLSTFISFLISLLFSKLYISDLKNKGAFVQGSFRGNFAIVGLAVILNVSGSAGAAKAALILGFLLPLYNILSVVALYLPFRKEAQISTLRILKDIFTNPLILAVIFSIPISYFEIRPYEFISKTISYLASISLPLALIGIGGSLNWNAVKTATLPAVLSSALKIIVYPLIFTIAAYYFGYRETDLMILFILFACPTAVVSFIMAEAMGSNGKLAGNIIVITTIGFIFTMSLGIIILRELTL
jgi:hypothetical protein